MAEKVTWMVLKVDLQCPCCYKKVKKILCKFPQIRDQVFDEQKNLVKITVVCCSPEKIRDKLCCKGAKVIHSIEIVEPPKPKPPPEKPPKPAEKPKEPEKPPKPAEKPKEPEKPPKPAEKPKDPPPKPAEKPKDPPPKPAEKAKDPPSKKPDPAPAPPPVILPPPPQNLVVPPQSHPVPIGFCCPQCYDGHGGGPCYHGHGRPPPPPPPCYDSYYGHGYNNYGKGCYVSRCDFFSEENTSGCTNM